MDNVKVKASIQLMDKDLNFSKGNLPNKARVKISINTHQQIANNTHFSKDILTQKDDDLDYIAIIGHYNKNGKDFEDHGTDLIKDEEGVIQRVKKTRPYGTTIAGTKKIETIDGQEYVTCEGYVWLGLYPELAVLFDGKPNNQSMEIKIGKVEKNTDGSVEILDFSYKALCILGKEVEPAFDKAKITAILEEENKSGQEDFKMFMQEYFGEMFSKILTEINKSNTDNKGEDNMAKDNNTPKVVDKTTKVVEANKTVDIAEYNKVVGENTTLEKANKEFESNVAELTKQNLELKATAEKFAELEKELNALKQEKFEKEVESVFNKGKETLKEEDLEVFKKSILESKEAFSVEEVETKLFALIGQKALKGELKEAEGKKPEEQKDFSKEVSYGLSVEEVGQSKASGKSYEALFAKEGIEPIK